MQKKTEAEKPLRVIPEYREEIDVKKICKALIMAARDMAEQSENERKKDAV